MDNKINQYHEKYKKYKQMCRRLRDEVAEKQRALDDSKKKIEKNKKCIEAFKEAVKFIEEGGFSKDKLFQKMQTEIPTSEDEEEEEGEMEQDVSSKINLEGGEA